MESETLAEADDAVCMGKTTDGRYYIYDEEQGHREIEDETFLRALMGMMKELREMDDESEFKHDDGETFY